MCIDLGLFLEYNIFPNMFLCVKVDVLDLVISHESVIRLFETLVVGHSCSISASTIQASPNNSIFEEVALSADPCEKYTIFFQRPL